MQLAARAVRRPPSRRPTARQTGQARTRRTAAHNQRNAIAQRRKGDGAQPLRVRVDHDDAVDDVAPLAEVALQTLLARLRLEAADEDLAALVVLVVANHLGGKVASASLATTSARPWVRTSLEVRPLTFIAVPIISSLKKES